MRWCAAGWDVIRECFSDAEVIEAGSATEALSTSTGTIDIALVDVRMPDADGLERCTT